MKIRIPAALLAASVALLLARSPADAKEFYVGEPIVKNEMQLVPHYLGSGLIDHSQKMTVAAIQIADKNV